MTSPITVLAVRRRGRTAPRWSSSATTTPTRISFALVRLTDSNFFVHGEIGSVDDGTPASNLHTLTLDDDNCPTPADEPFDYPAFPDDLPDIEPGVPSTYQCLKVAFVETDGGTDDPLGVDVRVQKGQKLLELTDAGLTNIPKSAQITFAEAPKFQLDGETFRRQCGTPAEEAAYVAEDPEDNTDICTPPIVRLDTKGDAVLYGMMRMGDKSGLANLDAIDAHDDAADFKALPGAAGEGWDDWKDPVGVRAKLAVDKPDLGPAQVALAAGIRLAVPRSLTIDRPLAWEYSVNENGDDVTELVKKDLKFGLRVGNGTEYVDSIGQAAALIQLDDGRQMLLSDGGEKDNEPDDLAGLTMPGEFRFVLYNRETAGDEINEVPGQSYTQIDGRTNTPLDLRLRLKPKPDVADKKPGALGNIDARALNLPTTDGPEWAADPRLPSFRIVINKASPAKHNIDLIKAASKAAKDRADLAEKFGLTPDQAEIVGASCDDTKNRVCTIAQVKIPKIDALIDFKGETNKPVRRLYLSLATFKRENAVSLSTLGGIDNGEYVRTYAKVNVRVDPLTLYHERGIPWLGGFQLGLVSSADVHIEMFDASSALVKLNGPHFTTSGDDQGSEKTEVFIKPVPTALDMLLTFLGLPLYSAHSVPGINPMRVYDCEDSALAPYDKDTVTIDGEGEWVVLPYRHLLVHGGLLRPLGKIAWHFVPVGVCNGKKWVVRDLLPFPGSPTQDTTHPIPGATLANPNDDPPSVPELKPDPPQVIPNDGESHNFCGTKDIESGLVIEPGATLTVGCAEHENTQISVGGVATIAGTLVIERAEAQAILSAVDIVVEEGGQIRYEDGGGNLSLEASDELIVSGVIDVAENSDTAPSGTSATTGFGAGHYGNGGAPGGGVAGTPGSPYADKSLTVDPEKDGIPVTLGSGKEAWGGGAVKLQGDRIRITGTVDASGGDGLDGDNDPDNCADGDDPHPVVGAGGGSGGTVLLSAREVNLIDGVVDVSGGAGNIGTKGGGGGGSAGIVKIISPIFRYDGNSLVQTGGAGGPNRAPTWSPAAPVPSASRRPITFR